MSITYNATGSPLAADAAGNRVGTNGLSVTVPPFVITTTVTDDQPSTVQGCITLTCGSTTETFSMLPSDEGYTADKVLAKAESSDIRVWKATANLRNIFAAAGSNTASVTVKVGLAHASGVKHTSSKVSMNLKWGSSEISTDSFYMCSSCIDPFLVGVVKLDLDTLTVEIDTSGVSTLTEGYECPTGGGSEPDPPPPPPPIGTVSVKAGENYCSGAATLYAGDYYPLLWDSSEKVVEYDETTTVTTALQNAALGVASSEKANDYIISEDGKCYWADDSYIPESATEIELYLLYDGVTGKALWTDRKVSETSEAFTTGRIWDNASDVRLQTIEEQRAYPASGTEVANELTSVQIPPPVLAVSSAFRGKTMRGYFLEHECSAAYITCPDCWQGAAYGNKTVNYLTVSGSRAGVSISGVAAPFITETPDPGTRRCDNTLFYDADVYASISCKPCAEDDELDGVGLVYGETIARRNYTGPTEGVVTLGEGVYQLVEAEHAYVYDFVRRWRTTDCYGEGEAVFTRGSSARCYATAAEAEDANPNGGMAIVRRGNSRYSIDFAGSTYKRTGLPLEETAAAIEEEFE